MFPDSNGWIGYVARRGGNDGGMCLPVVDLYAAEYNCTILGILDEPLLFVPVLLSRVAGTAVGCPACDQICELSRVHLPRQ